MKRHSSGNERFSLSRIAPAVLLICLLAGASSAMAVDYYVFGQVFRVSSEDAADESIPAASLTGDPVPFVHVQVYDRSSGILLGTADAGQNGQFTVRFSLPAGPPGPDVDARVYRVVDGGATLLPAAREEINFLDAIGQFNGAALKVVSDELLEYGTAGFVSYPGVGLVFTRVGKVEIPFISQNTTLANRPVAGLADFSPDPGRAAELGVADFRQAPFAGLLQAFGDFGLPGGACTGSAIEWYQVRIKKIAEASDPLSYESDILWQDPMHKIRTQVTTLPTLSVSHTTEKIGPFAGFLDDLATPVVDEGDSVAALYFVNRNEVGGLTSTFYSFPDLRMNWVSSAANGLYELSLVYYRQVGTAASGEPILRELPAGCFTGSPPPASGVALHRLTLRVNNQPLRAHFDHIYLRNTTTDEYFAGSAAPDVPTTAGALDFNDDGLCDIMPLASAYDVEIHFTAHHEGGYMHSYNLAAVSNSGAVSVSFDSETFGSHTTALNPVWPGTAATGTEARTGGFTTPCAYLFDLSALSRLQDGYHYIQSANPERAYYVTP